MLPVPVLTVCARACVCVRLRQLRAGAWLTLDCAPEVVIKDRVMGWRPGRPKPVWTELMNALDDKEVKRIVSQVYPRKGE